MPSASMGGMQKPRPCGGGSGLVGWQAWGDAAADFKSGLWEGYSGKKEVVDFGDVKWQLGPTLW